MIFDSFDHTLPGLLPASFRGIPFFVPDTSIEVGRRIAEHLFPGIDPAAYDDFGLSPELIDISGMIVGDDYIVQAQLLRAAFNTAGPGTLIHPWFGPMSVILEQPAEISFSAFELRVMRFNATFKRQQTNFLSGFMPTASLLIAAALSLVDMAAAFASSPSKRTLSRLRIDATQRATKQVTSYWNASTGQASAQIKVALPVSLVASPQGFAISAAAITDVIVGLVDDLANPSSVAPSSEASSFSGLDVRQALDLLSAAGNGFTTLAKDATSHPDTVLLLGAAADALAKAAHLSAYVDHSSRADALSLRDGFVQQFDSFIDTLGTLYDGTYAAIASQTSRSIQDLRLALIADINETIGRLPAAQVLVTERQTDAFQIANHLYGDNPAAIEDGYQTIIDRNRPRHPAYLPAGRIEVTR